MSVAVRNDLRGWRAVDGPDDVLPDEHYSEAPPELLAIAADLERQWRDAELTSLVWLRDRHRDQLEIGVTTTLTAEQFSELLVFMQALRDWPQSEVFPNTSARPVPPAFLEQMRIDQ